MTPPTLHAVFPPRSVANSQLPSFEQVAGPVATQAIESQGMKHELTAAILSFARSLSACLFEPFTGVAQPHDKCSCTVEEHWSVVAPGLHALARFRASAYWLCRAEHVFWQSSSVQPTTPAWHEQLLQPSSAENVWPSA